MPGFSADDQAILAALVRGQRRKLSRTLFGALASDIAEPVTRLCVVLRLAILLNRSRVSGALPQVSADRAWSTLTLRLPEGWLRTHPLTEADLRQEAEYLATIGVKLRLRRSKDQVLGPIVPSPKT